MEYEELQIILNNFVPELSKPSRDFKRNGEPAKGIIKAAKEVLGKILSDGNCVTCIFEAYFELKLINQQKLLLMNTKKRFSLKPGTMPYIGFLQKFVTNESLTDEVAIKIVEHNQKNAALFNEGEILLAEVAKKKVVAPTTVVEEANPEATTNDASTAEVNPEVKKVLEPKPKKKSAAKK